MAEEAKNVRRTAKSRFTRKRNELLRSIAGHQAIEVVEGNFTKLTEAWDLVEGKHDIYMMHLADDETEMAERWITELQEQFADATSLKVQYIKDFRIAESRAREDAARHESMRIESFRAQRAIDQSRIKRDTAHAVFQTLHTSAMHMLSADTEIATPVAKSLKIQLDEAFMDCKLSNNVLLSNLTVEAAKSEMNWISDIQLKYNEIKDKLETIVDACARQEKKPEVKKMAGNLQLEKIKLPRFDGEVREYPQFKRDFQKYVKPNVDCEDISYVLRSCLGKLRSPRHS